MAAARGRHAALPGASAGAVMPDTVPPTHDEPSTEQAFARVLRAEADARRAIEAARAEAAAIAEHARAQARQVAERAEQRIARGHAAVQRQLAGALAVIEASARALPEHDEPDDAALARLEAVLGELAAELSGAGEAGPSGQSGQSVHAGPAP